MRLYLFYCWCLLFAVSRKNDLPWHSATWSQLSKDWNLQNYKKYTSSSLILGVKWFISKQEKMVKTIIKYSTSIRWYGRQHLYKKGKSEACSSVDKPWGHYATWNETVKSIETADKSGGCQGLEEWGDGELLYDGRWFLIL